MDKRFLQRWSARKHAARRRAAQTQAALAAREEATATQPDDIASAGAAPQPEVDLAALPKLEELRADTDITVFMRPGVPAALRNAALRRMWLLDPAIRDFVGEARDYSFDWNAPGGVPGNGPLEPQEVATLLRRVFGGVCSPADAAGAPNRAAPRADAAAPNEEVATARPTPQTAAVPSPARS